MGEARRALLKRRAFEALPLYLQQPSLPALMCECLRPGWDGSGALSIDNDGYGHMYCQTPFWVTAEGQSLRGVA